MNKKTVFVIMPFRETPTRNKEDLTSFFENNLKTPIESSKELNYKYVVKRSDDAFDINEQIIKDLYNADIVLCDLSGETANPNVMYELGVRLSVSHAPVILFREEHKDNKSIFDINGFHCHGYSPFKYNKLEQYVINKIISFETQAEQFISPVLKILSFEPSVIRHVHLDRAIRTLEAISLGLKNYTFIATDALHRFLKENDIEIERSPSKVTTYLLENLEKAKELSWEHFNFSINSFPALTSYLVEYPLHDLIDKDIHRAFNTWLTQFDSIYISSTYGFYPPAAGKLVNFLTELIYIQYAIHSLFSYLSGNNVQKDKTYILEICSWIYNSRSLHPTFKREMFENTTLPSEEQIVGFMKNRVQAGSVAPDRYSPEARL